MSAKKTTSLGDINEPQYALVDVAWRNAVNDRFKEGAEQFKELMEKQDTLLVMLQENTLATTRIDKRVSDHIANYTEFTLRVQPAVDAVTTMQAGVRVIGKIGGFFAWCGKWLRKFAIWATPIVAIGAAVWHFFHPPKP